MSNLTVGELFSKNSFSGHPHCYSAHKRGIAIDDFLSSLPNRTKNVLSSISSLLRLLLNRITDLFTGATSNPPRAPPTQLAPTTTGAPCPHHHRRTTTTDGHSHSVDTAQPFNSVEWVCIHTKQKMHPSMYDDHIGSEKLRCSVRLVSAKESRAVSSKKSNAPRSCSESSSSTQSDLKDHFDKESTPLSADSWVGWFSDSHRK
ncbi:uncharacterized protein LOC130794907 [Actinidia eriantha]|uniref:uncharacterized protein LOC130794907 n=1 Tax=Actinidia eriantha TaxID=165200 RepID=UPI0025842888|nr:uncharacterized protein LOC130794907 [Actinidia eriantha]